MSTSGQAPTEGEEPTADDRSGGPAVSRRGALRAIGGGVAAGAALSGASTTVRAQSDGTDLASWFEGTSNYDGVADETGSDSVTVNVGVEANGGAFGFGPAAVRVDPGTTVTWKWTGKGGSHNVVHTDGSFESELTDKEGHTFSHTFEETGAYTYFCRPHKTLGMKGAVVVGDVEVNAGGGGGGSTESGGRSTESASGTGTPSGGDAGASGGEETLGPAEEPVAAPFGDAGARRLGGLALGGVFGLALASPGLFGAFVWLTGRGDERPDGEE